jgi:hypothetical protein
MMLEVSPKPLDLKISSARAEPQVFPLSLVTESYRRQYLRCSKKVLSDISVKSLNPYLLFVFNFF